jgi:hypothetical protein
MTTISHPIDSSLKTKPVTIIRPSRGWVSLKLRELWEYRELLFSWPGATSQCATSRRFWARPGPLSSLFSPCSSSASFLAGWAKSPLTVCPIPSSVTPSCSPGNILPRPWPVRWIVWSGARIYFPRSIFLVWSFPWPACCPRSLIEYLLSRFAKG